MSDKPETNIDSTDEWRARTGAHYELDTTLLRMLDGMVPEGGSTDAVAGIDPYNHTTTARQSRRRSLDDMRNLSEAIKKSRNEEHQ
jgi:hypothetical protein